MILYDDKYNFLGMSAHTLGFLGYEDIGEFLSMHNDFANLFVNKEGYIYKFDNFAWIDFVLFSGSSNKKAIVTLKNGQETEIALSIKEVFLTQSLGDAQKLYSVKIISNNFHEISGTPKESSSGAIGGFSLGGLVKKEPSREEKAKIEEEKSEFQNLIEENKQQDTQKSESFILNIADNELISKEDIKLDINNDDTPPQNNEDFKLNLLDDVTPLEIKEQEDPVIVKSDDVKLEPLQIDNTPAQEPLGLNFLKDADEDSTMLDETNKINDFEIKEQDNQILDLLRGDDAKEEPLQIDSAPVQEPLELNFLKDTKEDSVVPDETNEAINFEIKEQDNPVFNLLKDDKEEPLQTENRQGEFAFNLLNEESNTVEEIDDFTQEKEIAKDTNFNFKKAKNPLKDILQSNVIQENNDSEQLTQEITQTDTKQESEFQLGFLKFDRESAQQENLIEQEPQTHTKSIADKSHIIQQIKDDIKEIDTKVEVSDLHEDENSNFMLDIPDMPQVEQPLNLEAKADEQESAQEEDTTKSMQNLQIQQSQISDTDKSFTHTLKGLFDNNQKDDSHFDSTDETSSKEADHSALEEIEQSDKESGFTLNFGQEHVETSSNDHIPAAKIEPVQEVKQEAFISSLSSLGLSPDDEFDLLSDFISDTQDSIDVMEEFTKTKDLDKINYSLVKIKSSAEILNLDAIIDITNSIREECTNEDIENIITQTNKLKDQVELLKKNLVQSAV